MIKQKNILDLKLLIVLALFVFSTFIANNVFAESNSEFGYRLIPNKIAENSQGVLQVYLKDDIGMPSEIDNLVVTSSDSSIIRIEGIEEDPESGITSVKIESLNSGTANIALAAPGFSSLEFEITVYSNSHNPSKLIIQTTPDVFSINGPKKGYVSVELTDENDFPTRVFEDTVVTLSSSTSDVLTLKDKEVVIKKDQYFAITEFNVNQAGSTLIYASSEGMETTSSKVTLNQAVEPLTVKLYVYPQKVNSFFTSYAYAIVELQDANGKPVIAEKNIPVSLSITDPNLQSVNTSEEILGIKSGEHLEIKKGQYLSYAKIVTKSGLKGTYDVAISTNDYLVSDKQPLELVNLELLVDESPRLDILPILSTGREELIGILHLDDSDGNPVAAVNKLQIKIDSSDENSLSVNTVKLDKGLGVAPVFAKVGYSVPDSLTLHVAGEDTESIEPEISETSGQTLVITPLISKIISNTNFPSLLFLENSNGESSYFSKDFELSIIPNEFVKITSEAIKKGQSTNLLDSLSVKEGLTEISVEGDDLSASTTIESVSSEFHQPDKILLEYPETILSGLSNSFSVELLDSEDSPVFADKDMEIKIVSNDPSVLALPESVKINAGEYYAIFNVTPQKEGETELAVLTSEIPLSKFDVNVVSISPEISLTPREFVNPDTDFDITLSAQYHDSPLLGLNVEWNVQGASIKNMESITNENGMATISLHSEDPTSVSVQASVSGGAYGQKTVNSQIKINQPIESSTTSQGNNQFNIMGINVLFIIIPAAVGGTLIILKKKNMLDGIFEKLNVEEKITEIKEKLIEIRER